MNRDEILKALKECRDLKKLLEFLESKKLKLSDKTDEGETLLHLLFSVPMGYYEHELAQSLIHEKEVDINAVNAKGKTCFDLLIKSSSCYIQSLGSMLLHRGLHRNRENHAHCSPLHSLIQYQPVYWQELARIVLTEKIDPSLDTNIDPGLLNQQGQSYLDLLFQHMPYGWEKLAHQLIQMGANVTKLNSENNTYLHRCLENSHSLGEAAKALIKKMEEQGISTLPILFQNISPKTHAHNAFKFFKHLQTFVESGADLYACDNDGKLPWIPTFSVWKIILFMVPKPIMTVPHLDLILTVKCWRIVFL